MTQVATFNLNSLKRSIDEITDESDIESMMECFDRIILSTRVKKPKFAPKIKPISIPECSQCYNQCPNVDKCLCGRVTCENCQIKEDCQDCNRCQECCPERACTGCDIRICEGKDDYTCVECGDLYCEDCSWGCRYNLCFECFEDSASLYQDSP